MGGRDSIRGLLWGVAVGDALGAPHEHRRNTRLKEYTGCLSFPVILHNQWQGRRAGVIGQITDDTEMMIALASSIVSTGGYDATAAVRAYLEWGNSGCYFMGYTTRKLLQGVKTVKGYDSRFVKMYAATHPGTWSQSNGCLMRCAPLAALRGDQAEAAARLDCMLTNPHPICVEVCALYVRLAQKLLGGDDPESLLDALVGWADTDAVKDVIREALDLETGRVITGNDKGWILHAFWCAVRGLKLFAYNGTYEDTVDWIIRLGGDTDTNACIAGALIGASMGYESMASEQRTGVNIAAIAAANTSNGDLARPAQYGAGSIDPLAHALGDIQ